MTVELVCPECHSSFNRFIPETWKCTSCGLTVPLRNGIPLFTASPLDLNPSERIERCAEQGSIWRQFNWKFIEHVSGSLPAGSDVLDVGAGRADFKKLFGNHAYIGLDIYPYPELDLAVDLIKTNPFPVNSFDLVVLANVIEHVYEYRALVRRCATLIKPGGRILITVPFLLKLHQEPVDFHRYTRYALTEIASENGLEVEILDGYYNPLALLDEGIGNVWEFGLPETRGIKRIFAKLGIFITQRFSNSMKRFIGNGTIKAAKENLNQNVLGYQCLFRKNKRLDN